MCIYCMAVSAPSTPVVQQQAALVGSPGFLSAAPVLSETTDAAGGTATTYVAAIGTDFSGRLSSGTDADWVAVDLVAGSSYLFTAHGTGGTTAGVNDTILRLMNGAGTQVAINEDISAAQGNRFSAIAFTAATTGRYFLNVSAFGGETGTYEIQVASNILTLDQVVTQLTEVNWGAPIDIAFPVGPGGQITVNISGLSADGQRLALAAMDAWEYATGIDLATSTAPGAMIVIDDTQAGAFGGPSSYLVDTGATLSGTVNIGTDWLTAYGRALNSYGYTTFIHEIGHALGLAHPGAYNGGGDFAQDAMFLNDSNQMTVMSYFNAVTNTFIEGTDWIAVTPMIADIASMQALYGTPTTVNVGDTVWGVASNVGGSLGRIFSYAFDLVTPDANFWTTGVQAHGIGFTIYDNGGTDLFDVSTYAGAQVIDLRSEGVSNVLGEVGNVVIMRGSVIENAKTGIGADRITGNEAANRIEAGAGNDTVDGGAGSDTAFLNVARSSVTATAVEGGGIRIVSALGTDIYTNIEFFQFADQTVAAADVIVSDPLVRDGGVGPDSLEGGVLGETFNAAEGNDTVLAGFGNDTVHGGIGNDSLNGEAGSDVLNGEDGNDTLIGLDGFDTASGGAGADYIDGGERNDSLSGGTGNDLIFGGNKNDVLSGDEGADTLGGGTGIDVIEGGSENDVISGSFGNDLLYGGLGDDNMTGDAGRDLMQGGTGNDTLGGGENADTLFGEDGNDFLSGGFSLDTLKGDAGLDTLLGGEGSDELWGGTGADLFVFNLVLAPRGGTDTIRDWEDGVDHMRIVGVAGVGQAAKFGALHITSNDIGTTISYAGQTIVLTGVAQSQVDQSDFILA